MMQLPGVVLHKLLLSVISLPVSCTRDRRWNAGWFSRDDDM